MNSFVWVRLGPSLVACESASEALTPVQLKRQRTLASCLYLMATITSRYGEKYSGMAKIRWGRSRMAEITLRGTLGCLAYQPDGCFFGCGFCFLSPLVRRKASQPR